MVLLAGCESTSATSAREAPRRRGGDASEFFARPQLSAAAFAFRHWEEHSRNDAFTYVVDPYDRRLPPRFRQRLQALLPRPQEVVEDQNRTFAFDKIVFPEGDWAYVTYRESDPFHAIEYTDVLRLDGEQWVLLDHFVVAEGLMNTVMIDFQWAMYRETHLNLNAEPDASADAPDA